jgi:hypothetical protein
LFDATAARSDSPDYHPIDFDGNAAAKDHDSGVVGRVEPEALLATLRQARQVLGRRVKGSRSPSLVDCDIHAPQPGTIHSYVCYQAAAGIGNGDVVGDTHFKRRAFTCGDNSARISKVQRKGLSSHVNLLW